MTQDLVSGLKTIVGDDGVVDDRDRIVKTIRDNSWLSPVLSDYIQPAVGDAGALAAVAAVVTPRDLEELRAVLRHAYRHRCPMVVRGGGTTNFGQTTPLEGGVVIDTTELAGNIEVGEDWIEADTGTLQQDLDAVAAREGRELTVLTTTYASSTIGGWICGGHVGLGTSQHGTIWDGNVRAVELYTVEDEPARRRLEGGEVLDALHAYGTTGVVTRVRVPTMPRRSWREGLAAFSGYEAATRYVTRCKEHGVRARVVAAQEPPILSSITPLRRLGLDGDAGALIIVDDDHWATAAELADAHGGGLHEWRPSSAGGQGPSVGLMVYGHRMLWIKKRFPEAAFMHIYFRKQAPEEHQAELKRLAGDRILLEFKYMASPWLSRVLGQRTAGALPAAVLTVVDGGSALDDVRKLCARLGVRYRDPHTFSLRESGIVPHVDSLLDAKRANDPGWLLNPGKLAGDHEREWKEVDR